MGASKMVTLNACLWQGVSVVNGCEAQAAGVRESINPHARGFLSNRCPLVHSNREEHVYDGSVEQFARFALNFVARCLEGNGRTVWPVRGHGVKTVGHGEDPGAPRNFLGLQSPRISAAVPSLVMRKNDFSCVREKRNAFHQVITCPHVALHHFAFLWCQSTGLQKNPVERG